MSFVNQMRWRVKNAHPGTIYRDKPFNKIFYPYLSIKLTDVD